MNALESARGMVQILVRAETPPIARATIQQHVATVLNMNAAWKAEVDADALTREVETMFSVRVGTSGALADDRDHIEWLRNRREGINWRFWNRYRLWMGSNLSAPALTSLEETTDEVLRRIEDPRREGSWDRRGLVVGHVQSGKTGNYTGLICKAADAGYRVIVVLAGVHKSLRSQTQIRLDEGFLGYDSMPRMNGAYELVGAGELDPQLKADAITNRGDDGDFSLNVQKNFAINPGGNPLLFVVKKNKSVLNNLLKWVKFAAMNQPVLLGVPLLVIDDEADHASVDTKLQALDDKGRPDPDHDPTAINSCIRKLLKAFEKKAYVGYTATPFANIFIHEKGKTDDEGEDLFPRSFIVNLPAPSNYVGPVRVFGLDTDGSPDGGSPGLPLIRPIEDFAESLEPDEDAGWMPPKHGTEHQPLFDGEDSLPPSLNEAILAFVLACAARRTRGQLKVHNSMLIHVTRFVDVQNRVHTQVKDALQDITERLKLGEGKTPKEKTILGQLEALWTRDFAPTQKQMADESTVVVSWKQVQDELLSAASAIQTRRINGSADDILDYEAKKDTGVSIIAVGGDKLSRGLTLSGLTVSYFLRASRMYDTLMQMGRWFGYRDGYLDLCRLYMPEELGEWFRHIAAASDELTVEFDRMVAAGGTPREYGLKVRSHPSLMVTSLVKMRNGAELDLSFAGDISETVVFNKEKVVLEANLKSLADFIVKLGKPIENPVQTRPEGKETRWEGTRLWRDVSASNVCQLLRGLHTHPRATWVNSKLMAKFIEEQVSQNELLTWTVALIGKKGNDVTPIGGFDVSLIERANEPQPPFPDRYTIKRLVSPRDESIDIDQDAYLKALEATRVAFREDPGRSKRTEPPDVPSGPSLRAQRSPKNGLLLIYPLDWQGKNLEADLAPIGFAVSFPRSTTAKTVKWRVNNVYWTQETGND